MRGSLTESTENDVCAAMAMGKKIVVLHEEGDYELCIPEGGIRPKDSFWRKKKEMLNVVSPLVAIVRMSEPPEMREPSIAKLASERESEPEPRAPEPEPREPEPEPSQTKIAAPIKLRLLRKNVSDAEIGLEKREKICIDCELPYPLESFYTNSSAKDGRQSRCKECDNRRRAEHNQGLHVKASYKVDFDRQMSRKRAMEVAATMSVPEKTAPYNYKGVSGGFLIYGYVR